MKMWIGVTQKYMNKTVAEKKLKASEERFRLCNASTSSSQCIGEEKILYLKP
jgi:hypothetical protein